MTPKNVFKMTPASHSTWKPKPKNWRERYGYRPHSLAQDCRSVEFRPGPYAYAYIQRMAKQLGISVTAAEERADAQRRCELISATVDRDSTARVEEWLSPSVCVRTIKVYATAATLKNHDRGDLKQLMLPGFRESWTRVKPDAQTTYRVLAGGRLVDSFLTKSRAVAKARMLIAA